MFFSCVRQSNVECGHFVAGVWLRRSQRTSARRWTRAISAHGHSNGRKVATTNRSSENSPMHAARWLDGHERGWSRGKEEFQVTLYTTSTMKRGWRSLILSRFSHRHGRMQHIARESYKKSPRVRVWLELGGKDGAGSVEVGQATTLGKYFPALMLSRVNQVHSKNSLLPEGVRAVLPGNIGVRIVDCSALDGLGESSQKLLDERGCPVDEQASLINFTNH